jgi:hypothetical protein
VKLTFKQLQPYRIWYEYLCVCLKHKELRKKIDRKFYKSWDLNQLKSGKFDKWFKTHSHLFVEKKKEITLFNGKKTPNTLLVEIPTNLTVEEIMKDIGKTVKGKVAQKHSRFATTNPKIKTQALDYFRYCWELRQQKKYQGKGSNLEIHEAVNKKIKDRQSSKRMKTMIDRRKLKSRGLAGNYVQTDTGHIQKAVTSDKQNTKETTSILISRSINKADKILNNVCKGLFPGDYADH